MNRRAYCGLLVVYACACRHPEAGKAVETNAITSDHATETRPASASASRAPGECVVPLDEVAAPQAERATSCPLAHEPRPNLPMGRVTFDDAPRKPRVDVELAQNDSARQRGLMYRTRMGEYEGMLFSWDEEAPRTFWMHDTCLPLDMLFVSKSGVIAGVLEQVPVLNDAPRGIPCPVAHVLEVNAGWVRAHGVKPGQHVTISQ